MLIFFCFVFLCIIFKRTFDAVEIFEICFIAFLLADKLRTNIYFTFNLWLTKTHSHTHPCTPNTHTDTHKDKVLKRIWDRNSAYKT